MNSSALVVSVLVVLLVGSSLQEPLPQSAGGSRGNQGGDGRYGFNIVDTPDRYGYEANFPGGRSNYFLLGPNRAPGARSGR